MIAISLRKNSFLGHKSVQILLLGSAVHCLSTIEEHCKYYWQETKTVGKGNQCLKLLYYSICVYIPNESHTPQVEHYTAPKVCRLT